MDARHLAATADLPNDCFAPPEAAVRPLSVGRVRIQKVTNPTLAHNTKEAGADAGLTGLLAVARFGKRFWSRSAHVVKFGAIAVGQIRCGHEAPQ
jgi:hypothetical protein